jgi:hypothetical protein
VKAYLLRIFVAKSQLLNTILGGNVDETFSSRVGRAAGRGNRLGMLIERLLDGVLGKGHCRGVIEWDEA